MAPHERVLFSCGCLAHECPCATPKKITRRLPYSCDKCLLHIAVPRVRIPQEVADGPSH